MSRYFFALWPGAAERGELYRVAQEAQRNCGGRVMRRANLHQTLVFIGNVAAEKLSGLEAVANQIDAPSFKLEFGVTGYWRHNRIVWAAPLTTPEPLMKLVAALEQGLAQSGFVFERRPYAAHITLVRDARPALSLPALQFEWPIHDFALVESGHGQRGAGYTVVARWPLAG